MLNLILKTVLIYFFLLLTMRIMGKKQAGQLQPYELVITLIIAEVVSTPMGSSSIPFLHGVVPTVTLILLYYAFSLLTLKSKHVRRILCGAPSILIHEGKLDYNEIKRLDYSLNDLMEQLRTGGNTNISEIRYAILETNGNLTVFPYAKNCPLTPNDLKIDVDETEICTALVMDGKTQSNSLKSLGMRDRELAKLCHTLGYNRVKDIFILTYREDGLFFVQEKSGSAKNIYSAFKRNVKKEGING